MTGVSAYLFSWERWLLKAVMEQDEKRKMLSSDLVSTVDAMMYWSADGQLLLVPSWRAFRLPPTRKSSQSLRISSSQSDKLTLLIHIKLYSIYQCRIKGVKPPYICKKLGLLWVVCVLHFMPLALDGRGCSPMVSPPIKAPLQHSCRWSPYDVTQQATWLNSCGVRRLIQKRSQLY